MSKLPAVATNTYVFCKKCNTDRYFKVIAHTDPITAKLKCEVCGASRSLKLSSEKSASTAGTVKRASSRATSKKNSAEEIWTTYKDNYKGPAAIDYVVSKQFTYNDSLNHPTFGLGFVMKALPHKIEVLFLDGTKELVHSRK